MERGNGKRGRRLEKESVKKIEKKTEKIKFCLQKQKLPFIIIVVSNDRLE